jgi:NADH-ubiquinone oxidoreductase chain 5
MPFTYTALLIGSLSLIATPFLSGHYSKDSILETAAGAFSLSGTGGFILGTLGATLTAFYSVRLLAMTFLTGPNGPKVQYTGSHEAPFMLGLPLVILSVISITGGYLGRDLFLGMGTDGLSHALWVQPLANTLVDADFGLPQLVKLLPFLGTLAGALSATVLYLLMPKTVLSLTDAGAGAYRFLMGKWQWDAVVTNLFIGPGLTAGSVLSVSVDKGFVELVGPHGLTGLLPSTAGAVGRTNDSALVTTQALIMLVGLLAFMVAASGSHWGGLVVLFATLTVFLMTDRR